MELKLELERQVAGELPVRVGLSAANLMMEMRYREHNPKLLPQLQKHAQQSYRVCTAGDGYSGPFTRHEQTLFTNILLDFFDHGGQSGLFIVE